MNKKEISLLIDAAHLQINLRDHAERSLDKKDGADKYRMYGREEFAYSFWGTIGSFINLFLKNGDFDCYEQNRKLSVYLFDAQYDDSEIAELITTVRFLNPKIKERLVLQKEDAERIYSMSLSLPGDEFYVSDGTEPQELDMQIHNESPPGPFTFSDIPSIPGVYKGFLSRDDRVPSGINQKSVDTMLTLCGTLKANEGRSIALFSGDADFLPLANYVLSKDLHFFLVHASNISGKWKVLSRFSRFRKQEIPLIALFGREGQ